jgi:hypothetical protein
MSSPICSISARACSINEQREDARQRRPQLVRHRGGEARTQLLVGRKGAAAPEVQERLARPVDLDRHPGNALSFEQPRRQDGALRQTLQGRPGSTRAGDDAPLVIEHDDDLRTALDQEPAPLRVEPQAAELLVVRLVHGCTILCFQQYGVRGR